MTEPTVPPSFFRRVAGNDSARKGFAAAIAGVLVAAISEVLWPHAG